MTAVKFPTNSWRTRSSSWRNGLAPSHARPRRFAVNGATANGANVKLPAYSALIAHSSG